MDRRPPNDFKHRSADLLPREQMRRAASPRDVPDAALLAILLKTGTPGCDVLELARRLIAAFGNLSNLVDADWRTLESRICEHNEKNPESSISGIGPVKVLELAAAFEIARRSRHLKTADFRKINLRANTSTVAATLFRPYVCGEEQESFYVLPVDSNHHPMCEPIRITRGTVDGVSVHPREVFREAIRWGAKAILVAHNHPCGDPSPSEDDLALTRQLLEVSRLVSIPLLDHLVLGAASSDVGKDFTSIRRTGSVEF